MHKRPVRLRQITIGHFSVRVMEWEGDPVRTPILLFNGIGANIEILQPFIDALGDVTVICFDMPGTGKSLPPPFFYRMRTMARLASLVLRRLGHARADVVGVSWGGALAQEFAHVMGPRCRRLVLCATLAGAPAWPASPRVLYKMLTPERYLKPGAMRRDAGVLYGGRFRWDHALVEDYIARIRKPDRLGYLLQLCAIAGWSSGLWLWRLRQPTLILAGSDDPLAPPINARIMARLIPHARLEMFDGGHLFILAQAGLAAQRVRAFLDAADPVPVSPRPWAQMLRAAPAGEPVSSSKREWRQ
ncbi:MAG: alpha/beta fold hydrolase [Nevskiaceae bacterium]|nr:MAG: alpha/beta fold hydrolase [Nevskiaceae bacterium]TBR72660.1 MAG: alpha/beta fold hydrolase [Nevskiaceae bacterium]